MKKILCTILALTIALANAASAQSSSNGTETVVFLHYTNTGIVTVYVPINVTTHAPVINIPACATNIGNTYDYVFDSTTPAGKTLLAAVLSANLAGTGVGLQGTGDCGLVSGNET